MTALYILGGILLFIILLLLIKIGVFFSYYGKVPILTVKLAFIKLNFNLLELKKEAEEQSKEKKHLKKEKKKKKRKESDEKKPSPPVLESIRVFKDGAVRFWEKYKRYARLERYVVKISVGTDDPAKTAVLYGGIATVAGALHAWAVSVKRRSRRAEDLQTEVVPDFIAEKTDAAAEIGFSLRVWQILSCLITAYRTYRKYKKLPPKKGKDRQKGENNEQR